MASTEPINSINLYHLRVLNYSEYNFIYSGTFLNELTNTNSMIIAEL
jgi:hypothetical protein